MARRFRFVGNLSTESRIERYQVSDDKVLELGGEAQTLTDSQYEKAVQYIQLEEIPEGATDAQYGPSPDEVVRPDASSRPKTVDEMDLDELKAVAKDRNVEGRSGKSESELRELVRADLEKGA